MTKKQGIKVVTIGGGSSYTPELVEGFIKRYEQVPVRELWLVDIEAGHQKLEIVGALARRMVKKAGVDLTIYTTLDRKKALQGADFVTTQLRVGLLDARIIDERIPLQHGIIGQETNGAGGLFKALRTIPVLLDIAKDIVTYCPNAWLINFTNPAGLVTEALLRYSAHQKVIGVCNVPYNMHQSIASMLGVEKDSVSIDFAGLNHLVFGTHVYVDGEDVTDAVLELLSDPEMALSMKNIAPLPWGRTFLKALGLVPCPYHRYYYQTKKILEEELRAFHSGHTRAEVVKTLETELFQLYESEDLHVKPPQLEQRGGAYYSDVACNVIASIVNDTRDVQVLNVRNNGSIRELPEDAVVEVNCIVGKHGPTPLSMGALPIHVHGLLQQIKSYEQVAAKAAVTGSYEQALLAMAIHPLVPDEELAETVLKEMLAAHKAYLPQFFSETK
ncbi:Glycosyl hydrolase, family 4 [Fictibacillus macauensis ZFHKF-1]|uniref:6-phospho-beta-glucosidase n=1 Tax=Fictibacillus macauensis ZFHKF-1 TaxID=1196324 RepID=I8UHI6_9BACL|nr:6-phospho-beta-glucosidase [Fictibacillus macauensis]EIT86370.1 Glycosyl hydrolase, family 4 [Fictibacillus macauensis ZFHKF-1]